MASDYRLAAVREWILTPREKDHDNADDAGDARDWYAGRVVDGTPIAKLLAYRRRMGWTFRWGSSFGGDFNLDFNIQVTEQQQRDGGVEYNYRREMAAPRPTATATQEWQLRGSMSPVAQIAAMTGTDIPTYTRERPGMSAFVLEDGVVYHTYSTYARGLDALWGMYQWLDRAPSGRNEHGVWWRRHDEYATR